MGVLGFVIFEELPEGGEGRVTLGKRYTVYEDCCNPKYLELRDDNGNWFSYEYSDDTRRDLSN